MAWQIKLVASSLLLQVILYSVKSRALLKCKFMYTTRTAYINNSKLFYRYLLNTFVVEVFDSQILNCFPLANNVAMFHKSMTHLKTTVKVISYSGKSLGLLKNTSCNLGGMCPQCRAKLAVAYRTRQMAMWCIFCPKQLTLKPSCLDYILRWTPVKW